MNIRHILLTIWATIGLLAVVALVFPDDGLTVMGVDIRFPSIAEALGTPESPEEPVDTVVISPDEMRARQLQALLDDKDDEFRAYCDSVPGSIRMPADSLRYLDAVFEAFENSDREPVRIMHYGDSQLEGNRMTGHLREALQEMFGGTGPGMVPLVEAVPSFCLVQKTKPEPRRYLVFGPKSMRHDERLYGPLGQMARVDGQVRVTLTARRHKEFPHSQSWQRIMVMAQGDLTVTLCRDSVSIELPPNNDDTLGVRYFTLTLPRAVSESELLLEGHANVYGISLDGLSGISVDNVAMRGSSGSVFTGISLSTTLTYYRRTGVRLLLLQYGGNAVPGLKSGQAVERYKESMKQQLEYFKRILPEARIIFIGPADMSTKTDGKFDTYPVLPSVVNALREASLESGVAFWDMYGAMGGRGSMVRWVDDGLAGADYVHFSPSGSRKMVGKFIDALNVYYQYYQARKQIENNEE